MSIFKKKFFKWAVLVILAAIITGGILGYKMYNKPHRNVLDANAVSVTAAALAAQYEGDETKANGLYLDKVLNVNGEIIDIAKNQKGENVLTLKGTDMSGVICTLEGKEPAEVKKGDAIKLQGICTGYLTDVVLVRCYFSEK